MIPADAFRLEEYLLLMCLAVSGPLGGCWGLVRGCGRLSEIVPAFIWRHREGEYKSEADDFVAFPAIWVSNSVGKLLDEPRSIGHASPLELTHTRQILNRNPTVGRGVYYR